MSPHHDNGDALDKWFEQNYGQLRLLARARLRGGGRDVVLDTTALVHESFLRLAGRDGVVFPDRVRFLAYAAKAMRSIIVDLVRERGRERHGGDLHRITLSTGLAEAEIAGDERILHVHEAIDDLRRVDLRMAQVVELRYFAGLTDDEIAEALHISARTVGRDWQEAQLFLAEALL